jgi:hypothetical protein
MTKPSRHDDRCQSGFPKTSIRLNEPLKRGFLKHLEESLELIRSGNERRFNERYSETSVELFTRCGEGTGVNRREGPGMRGLRGWNERVESCRVKECSLLSFG